MLAKGCSGLDPVSRDDELSLPGVGASDFPGTSLALDFGMIGP